MGQDFQQPFQDSSRDSRDLAMRRSVVFGQPLPRSVMSSALVQQQSQRRNSWKHRKPKRR